MAVVAAVLVALAIVAAWQRRPREVAPLGPVPVFAEGAPELDSITVIELSQEGSAGNHGRLERREAGWVLTSRGDAPADAQRVERLLESLEGLVGEVRADDPGLLPEFQLSGDGVIRLALHAAEAAPLVLLVGKRGPRSNRSFVRPEGDDRAWLAHGPLHSALGIHGRGDAPLNTDHFLDLHLFRVEADEVLAVAVEGDHAWSLVRDSNGAAWQWDPPGAGGVPNERGATGKAHTVARLRASSLVGTTDEAAHGLTVPPARVTVRSTGGEVRTLLVGALVPALPAGGDATPREPQERFVRVDGEPWIWRVRIATLDALSRPVD